MRRKFGAAVTNAFASHRLTAWHRQGADVRRLLSLSTYLGHAGVASTQVYLSNDPGTAGRGPAALRPLRGRPR